MHRTTLIRLLIGWSLLAGAWLFANPPFAAPDEADHFIRTVGIAEGHLVGAPAPNVNIGADPAEIRFDKSTQRFVTVPARLDPTPFNCYLANPNASAGCLDRPARSGPPVRLVTSVGTYPPLPLLAPAALIRHADSPLAADRLARVASAVLALALLFGAAIVLFDAESGWLSLLGVLAACTPTAIFLAASLSPSGMAVCAAVAFSASLLAIGRERSGGPAAWILLGIGGAALELSHPTGLAWALLLFVGLVTLIRWRTFVQLVSMRRPASVVGLCILASGTAAALAWQALYGARTAVAYRAIGLALRRVPEQSWIGARELVAGFGYLEFRLPLIVYLIWFALIGAIVAAAIRAGGERERKAVLSAGVLAFVIPVGAWMTVGRAAGIGINGREYMPLLVALPMLAGEVLYRHRERVSGATLRAIALLATLAAVIQFVAWYLNGRRSAVGILGDIVFAPDARWTPPLGWALWTAVAAGGMALLASLTIRQIARDPEGGRLPAVTAHAPERASRRMHSQ